MVRGEPRGTSLPSYSVSSGAVAAVQAQGQMQRPTSPVPELFFTGPPGAAVAPPHSCDHFM